MQLHQVVVQQPVVAVVDPLPDDRRDHQRRDHWQVEERPEQSARPDRGVEHQRHREPKEDRQRHRHGRVVDRVPHRLPESRVLEQSRVVVQPDERLVRLEDVPLMEAEVERVSHREEREDGEQDQYRRQEQVRRPLFAHLVQHTPDARAPWGNGCGARPRDARCTHGLVLLPAGRLASNRVAPACAGATRFWAVILRGAAGLPWPLRRAPWRHQPRHRSRDRARRSAPVQPSPSSGSARRSSRHTPSAGRSPP